MKQIDVFGLVSFAPSLILGLGIARLMSDSVTLFRSRSRVRVHWIPIVWAFSIFLIQIQYLWGIIELHGLERTWTSVDFVLILGVALFLYAGSALVLPDVEMATGADLEANFLKDGRWSLMALLLAEIFAIAADFFIFRQNLLTPEFILVVAMALSPGVFLLSKSRAMRAIVTVVTLLVVIAGILMDSPKAY